MKKICVIISLFFITSLLFSQNVQFTVVAVKSTKVKKNGSSSFVDFNVGEKLNSSDVVVCNKDGSVSFLCSTGKVLSYNKSKEIKLSELLNISAGNSSKNLLGKLQNIAGNKSNKSSKVAANIGGVRLTESVPKNVSLITPSKKETKILDGYPVFNWNKVQGEDEYQLTILTKDFDVVKTLALSDTTYQYLKDDPKLEHGATYICIVKPLNTTKQNEDQTFTIVTNEELIEMNKIIDETKLLLSKSKANILTKSIILETTYESLELYSFVFVLLYKGQF